MADKNYKLLQGKKLSDKVIFVDYVGVKSKNMSEEKKIDPGNLVT